MTSFIISLLVLIGGYFIYCKLVERWFGIDTNRKTPVVEFEDGVDFVPLPWYKIFLIQFLNIAGLGPIFGALALFLMKHKNQKLATNSVA